MRIVWLSLLLLACGRPPQAGRVYSDASPAMLLGLIQNDGGAYELQLCKDGATGARKRQKAFNHAAALGAALHEGEKTRKAAQGRFAWFNYGDGGERVIDREQVLAALRNT